MPNQFIERVIEKYDLHLHVFQHRYGGKFCAFLCYETEGVSEIIECSNGADHYNRRIREYFKDAEWYPIINGNSITEVLHALNENISKYYEDENWRDAIRRAMNTFEADDRGTVLPKTMSLFMDE